MPDTHSPFILASASPQRKSLLEGMGVEFEIVPSHVDESMCPETDPAARAQALSKLKAEEVAKRRPEAYVLGADTLVVAADGTLFEKPNDADDARAMLRKHSGNTSVVHSAICLVAPSGQTFEALSSSKVQFADLDHERIEWWIETEEWRDRSGAFQIEGKGQLMIASLEGDWTGVVGLPVYELGRVLREAGVGQ